MHVSLLIAMLCLSVSSCTPSEPNDKTSGAEIASKNKTVVMAQNAQQENEPNASKANKNLSNKKSATKKTTPAKAPLPQPEESQSFFDKPAEFFAGLTNIKPYHGKNRGTEVTVKSETKVTKKVSAKAKKSAAKKTGNKSAAKADQKQLPKQATTMASEKPIAQEKPVAPEKLTVLEKPIASN